VAHSFLVIREGLESGGRLCARSMQRLTYQLRLALEPECLSFEPPFDIVVVGAALCLDANSAVGAETNMATGCV